MEDPFSALLPIAGKAAATLSDSSDKIDKKSGSMHAQVGNGIKGGNGQEDSFDPFEQLAKDAESRFVDRREQLLELAREDRVQFARSPGPEDDMDDSGKLLQVLGVDEANKVSSAKSDENESSSSNETTQARSVLVAGTDSTSDDDASEGSLEKLPDGFAFPVTTKIMQFLNRFSAPPSGYSKNDAVPALEEQSLDDSIIMEKEDEKPPLLRSSSSPIESSGPSLNDDKRSSPLQQTPTTTLRQHNSATKMASPGIGGTAGKKNSHYSVLINTLRDPQAVDLLGSIKNFVGRFLAEHDSQQQQQLQPIVQKKEALNDDSEDDVIWDGDHMPGQNNPSASKVQEFLRRLERKMRAHPLWRGYSKDDWEKTAEGLEKFVMLKIEKCAFQPTPRDRSLDEKLHYKIQSLSFLRMEHLELSCNRPEFEKRWQHCGEELEKINRFRSPRDKIVCILNCCRLITNVLRDNSASSDAIQVGADEFVPALIYVVLKTNPRNLHSNLDYIAAYRNPAKLKAEPGYFFTQIAMAVSFIQGLDQGLLNISPEEYNQSLALCKKRMKQDSSFSWGWQGYDPAAAPSQDPELQKENGLSPPLAPISLTKTLSVGSKGSLGGLLSKTPETMPRTYTVDSQPWGATANGSSQAHPNLSEIASALPPPPVQDTHTLQEWASERFRFATTASVNDLRVGQLQELLDEYKVLASAVAHMINIEKP